MQAKRLSWSIGVLIVVVCGAGAWWIASQLLNVTPTTQFVHDASNLGVIELPVSPQVVLSPVSDTDAGALYRESIELYLANPDPYDRFVASGRRSGDADGLDALGVLLRARDGARMNLFSGTPQQVVGHGDKPELSAIRTLGKAANRVGALLTYEKKPDEATSYHHGAFALGARLYEERLTLDELLVGLELMSEAAAGIVACGATDDVVRFAEFRAAYLPWYESRIKPMQRIITSIDPTVLTTHGGDILYIARHAPERMWRVEAIRALGRMRFNPPRAADRRAAQKLLDHLMNDPDPVIRAAVEAARSLTIEQYRMMK